jgi:hypothetical protein
MNVQVDERTLNEIYLPPDENAVKLGHTAAIMGAFNKVNGEADLPTLGRSSPACYLDQARNRDSFNHPSQARRLPTQNRLATALHSLGWEHINLTADDAWRPDGGVRNRRLRLLRLETQRYVPWRTNIARIGNAYAATSSMRRSIVMCVINATAPSRHAARRVKR